MTHWILQFAWRIAFRCVLHRCGSQDIRCWKCWSLLHFNVLLCILFRRDVQVIRCYNEFIIRMFCSWLSIIYPVMDRKLTLGLRRNCWSPSLSRVWLTLSGELSEIKGWFHGTVSPETDFLRSYGFREKFLSGVVMILPQVHLRKPCYDFTFL